MEHEQLAKLKEQVCLVGRRLYERGLVMASDGNISVRLGEGQFLITPTRMCKADMLPEDLVVVDEQMNVLSGSRRPSTEIRMHLKYYALRPDVNAVIHTHAPYSVAFAVTRQSLMEPVIPPVVGFLGPIPCARYGTPTTQELVDSVAEYAPAYNAMLLANHGSLVAGKDLQDAHFKAERLEFYCQTIFLARLMGGEVPLNEDELRRLALKMERQRQEDLA